MRAVKIVVVLALVYVGIVVAFESMLGFFQPRPESTIVLVTFGPGGERHERVVSRLESDGRLYVAANHWPRAWYHRLLESPAVQVTMGGETRDYRAVPVSGAEQDRVDADNPLPIAFRILTGFPPRLFVRLDPAPDAPG